MGLSFKKSKRHLLLAVFLLSFGACKQSEFYEKTQLMEMGDVPTTGGTGSAPAEGTDGGSDTGSGSGTGSETGPGLCDNGSTNDLICNPLGGGDGTTIDPSDDVPAVPVSRLGLIASLYEGQDQWNHIDRYLNEGFKHEENIYFSNFDVATRAFSEGFGYGNNDYLKNMNGDKLIEWFALQAKGNIVLPENEASGSYHIVSISDDGIRISIGGKTILENANIHAPTIDCATELVQLNSKEEKSFELTYFQGPRMHISLMTFIKKIDDVNAFKKESFCSTGNDANVLLQNGYKVISAAWFTLPAGY